MIIYNKEDKEMKIPEGLGNLNITIIQQGGGEAPDLRDYATIEYVDNQDAMLEESLVLLNNNITTFGEQVALLNNNVTTLENNLDALEGNVDTLEGNIILLDQRVTALEEGGGGGGGEVAKVICVNKSNFNSLEERQEAFTYFENLDVINANPYKYKLVYQKGDKEYVDFYGFKVDSNKDSRKIFLYYVDKYKVIEECWRGWDNFTSYPYTTHTFVREDKLKEVLNTKKIYINETYIYKEETNKFYLWNGSTETEKNINTILNAYIKNDKSIYQLCYTFLNVIFVEKGKSFSYNNCPLYKINSFEKIEEEYDAYGRYHFVGKGETKDLILDYYYGETQETIVYERKNVYQLNAIWDDTEQSYMVNINTGLRDAFLNGARVIFVIEGKLYEITKAESNQFSTSLIINEDGLGAKAYQINVIDGIGKVNEINISF